MANKKNLANSVLNAPIGTSDTSLTVYTGDGSLFPATPFYITLTPNNKWSRKINSEIVLVTNVVADTFTVTRAQKGTTAKEFTYGDLVANGIYVEDVDIHSQDAKTTPVDADEIGISDSAASNVNKRLTFANLWTWIQTKLSALTNVKTYSWVKDEDDFVSNDDTKVPTQQSSKAYVDNSLKANVTTYPIGSSSFFPSGYRNNSWITFCRIGNMVFVAMKWVPDSGTLGSGTTIDIPIPSGYIPPANWSLDHLLLRNESAFGRLIIQGASGSPLANSFRLIAPPSGSPTYLGGSFFYPINTTVN